MNSYHNPASVQDSLVGPHHKLLSTDDLDKPLPEGAEYWNLEQRCWKSSTEKGPPFHTVTYRIPLTLNPVVERLKAQRDRIDEQIAIAEKVGHGAKWEVNASSRWTEPGDQSLNSLDYCMQMGSVRLKPAEPTPQSIPWTLETRPLTETWLKHKNRSGWYLVGAWKDAHAFLVSYGFVLYGDLHSDWLQRNGEPAGEKVTV